MKPSDLANETNYSSMWQASVPDIAWGTISMFVGIILAYVLVISFTVAGDISFPIATLICSYLAFASFTVTHDAGHGSIIKMGSSLKPLEGVIGWLASVPMLIMPFRLFQKIHDRHHAFTNDPERDPDYIGEPKSWYSLLLSLYYTPFGYHVKSVTTLRHIKTISDTYRSSIIYFFVVYVPLVTLSLNGYALEVLCLAIIPIVIAIFFLIMFFDYVPHHPHKSLSRYQNSRIYGGRLLNVLLLGQNYHLIHHMYPRLPWYKYQDVYLKTLPELEYNGAPIENASSGLREGFMKSPNANKLLQGGQSLHHLLKVSDITQLTADSVAVEFELPEGEILRYQAGQYITVSKWLAGEQQTRCYSLCRAPEGLDLAEGLDQAAGSGKLKIAVKETPDGFVSHYMNRQLKVGDELIIQGPFGEFIYPPEREHQIDDPVLVDDLVLIAGGSGITPILSILETALQQSRVKNIYLIYAVRDSKSIMFFEHLEKLQIEYANRIHLSYVINEADKNMVAKSGRLDDAMLKSLLPMLGSDSDTQDKTPLLRQHTDFYICGPEGLKNVVVGSLESQVIEPDRIHIEQFVASYTEPVGELHQVDIALANGKQHSLSVAANQTILEVAQAKGVSLPHACGNGTCGSCKFKVESGNLTDIPDSIPGIVAEEKAAGYTLACQCRPLSGLSLSENLH